MKRQTRIQSEGKSDTAASLWGCVSDPRRADMNKSAHRGPVVSRCRATAGLTSPPSSVRRVDVSRCFLLLLHSKQDFSWALVKAAEIKQMFCWCGCWQEPGWNWKIWVVSFLLKVTPTKHRNDCSVLDKDKVMVEILKYSPHTRSHLCVAVCAWGGHLRPAPGGSCSQTQIS